MTEQPLRQILIIDDDLLIRELIELLLSRKGYKVHQAASGEEALAMFADTDQLRPSIVLADMQLPGMAGTALANRLRTLSGSGIRILAMSGSEPGKAELEGFDGFVRKPFREADLYTLLKEDVPSSGGVDSPASSLLNENVYESLAGSMSQEQLAQLYQLCLDDCRRRIEAIRQAAGQNNMDACRKEAHTIKGSCGMVGATEIASLGEIIESHGLVANPEDVLYQMMLACGRLKDQLCARGLSIQW
jgi:CheY-like chemotaxis protein